PGVHDLTALVAPGPDRHVVGDAGPRRPGTYAANAMARDLARRRPRCHCRVGPTADAVLPPTLPRGRDSRRLVVEEYEAAAPGRRVRRDVGARCTRADPLAGARRHARQRGHGSG